MEALRKIKQVSREDLRNFLASDHRSFTVLNISFKQILSTQRTSVILSKPSAKNFYLKDKFQPAKPELTKPPTALAPDCRITEKWSLTLSFPQHTHCALYPSMHFN